MKISLFLKIFLGFLLITAVLSTYILTFSFRTIKDNYIDTLANDLVNLGSSLLLLVTPHIENKSYTELNSLMKNIGEKTGRRITVIDTNGTVLADSERDISTMENHRNRTEVIRALNGKIGRTIRYSTTVKEEMLYIAMPVEENSAVIGVLRLSIYLRNINSLLNSLKIKIFLISIIIIIVSLIGAIVFSNQILRPIKQLIMSSKRVAQGDFEAKVLLKNRDELKELADNYNYMTDQLKRYMNELSFQKEELKYIISHMGPGLLVLNSEGKISLFNESLEKIIDKVDLGGKFYWQVFDDPKILELIPGLIKKKISVNDEVQINGGCYRISASYINAIDEAVFVFHDITDIRKLEKIKRDFVANVSHELRTPLTAIKGYAETIEVVSSENRQYIDIIKKHTDRLINIVEDLLTLSELEKRDYKLEIDDVDLNALLTNVAKMFENRASVKRLKIDLNIEERLPYIKGDSIKLEQVFINLMDNAVKYTERGIISVTAKKRNQKVEIEMKDTGIGIPEKHLPRIFERFYTVDKSHSRRLGGTGLGLSIAKHIISLHNGSINVESTPGKGSTFTIYL